MGIFSSSGVSARISEDSQQLTLDQEQGFWARLTGRSTVDGGWTWEKVYPGFGMGYFSPGNPVSNGFITQTDDKMLGGDVSGTDPNVDRAGSAFEVRMWNTQEQSQKCDVVFLVPGVYDAYGRRTYNFKGVNQPIIKFTGKVSTGTSPANFLTSRTTNQTLYKNFQYANTFLFNTEGTADSCAAYDALKIDLQRASSGQPGIIQPFSDSLTYLATAPITSDYPMQYLGIRKGVGGIFAFGQSIVGSGSALPYITPGSDGGPYTKPGTPTNYTDCLPVLVPRTPASGQSTTVVTDWRYTDLMQVSSFTPYKATVEKVKTREIEVTSTDSEAVPSCFIRYDVPGAGGSGGDVIQIGLIDSSEDITHGVNVANDDFFIVCKNSSVIFTANANGFEGGKGSVAYFKVNRTFRGVTPSSIMPPGSNDGTLITGNVSGSPSSYIAFTEDWFQPGVAGYAYQGDTGETVTVSFAKLSPGTGNTTLIFKGGILTETINP